MNGEQKRKKRERLWHLQSGRCWWCRLPMTRDPPAQRTGAKPAPTLATLDHLDDRLTPERGTYQGQRRIVLACWECNNKRNRLRQAIIPLEGRQALCQLHEFRKERRRRARLVAELEAEASAPHLRPALHVGRGT